MGCFNSTCLISRLPITAGDALYVIPMRSNEYPSINYGAETNYHLLCAPFQAEYDDYGFFENVKSQKAFDVLLKICDSKDIDELKDKYRADNRSRIKEQKNNSWTFAFVLKDVYESMAKPQKGFATWGSETWSGEHSFLVNFGFIKDEKETGDQRYREAWHHPLLPGFELWSDGWSSEKKLNGKKLESLYHVSDLLKFISKTFPGVELKFNKKILDYPPQYKDYFDRAEKLVENEHIVKELIAAYISKGQTEEQARESALFLTEIRSSRSGLDKHYGTALEGLFDWSDKEYVGGLHFITKIHELHYNLTPQIYHSQEYDYGIHSFVNKVVAKSIKKLKTKQDEWENE